MEAKDITFLLQGAVDKKIVREILADLRRHFDGARVILSTWHGMDTEGLDCDEVVRSDDPGFFYYSDRPGDKMNNVNRQIVGTCAGLERVETPYCFRMRTDFRLDGNRFLQYFGAFPHAEDQYRFFSEKLLAASYFSRNPRSRTRFPFHPSDLAFFGRTDDIRLLFNVPLMPEEEACWDRDNKRYNRYTPEQYIFINALRQAGRSVPCAYFNDDNERAIAETERYFASNFVFLTFEQFNLVPSKPTFFMKVHPNSFMTCYTHNEWLGLYKKHVDASIRVPDHDPERERIEVFYKPYRLCRLVGNIISFPFRSKMRRRAIRCGVLEFFLMPR
ncbi:WavE lipopolysaccharide synthesis family protein [Martelella mediterranea]|uniref:WavE lipopolysaccharide synthesis protein n=1 Tax=Martelella mediterranea TaxID=293089 RepID=A0A4R3P539_9HYPH|nr:WavE lipopolysaccharide synthesis family protein [Martelella mediterranea]TCT44632.1 WavE lipopolysaccharide synthesis protein [Martelella mediterranea]